MLSKWFALPALTLCLFWGVVPGMGSEAPEGCGPKTGSLAEQVFCGKLEKHALCVERYRHEAIYPDADYPARKVVLVSSSKPYEVFNLASGSAETAGCEVRDRTLADHMGSALGVGIRFSLFGAGCILGMFSLKVAQISDGSPAAIMMSTVLGVTSATAGLVAIVGDVAGVLKKTWLSAIFRRSQVETVVLVTTPFWLRGNRIALRRLGFVPEKPQ